MAFLSVFGCLKSWLRGAWILWIFICYAGCWLMIYNYCLWLSDERMCCAYHIDYYENYLGVVSERVFGMRGN